MSVKKVILVISVFVVMSSLIVTGIVLLSKTYYFRDAKVEGFVFVDKRFNQIAPVYENTETLTIKPAVHYMEKEQFIDAVLKNYADEAPLMNAGIDVAGTKSTYRTNDLGYFEINSPWRKTNNKIITISAVGIDVQFTLDMKNCLNNYLFVRISQEGIPEILCIRDDENGHKDLKASVVLIHGFGLDIGAFRPTAFLKGWEQAYNLFKQDPDFRDTHRFYILDHWDDESFVKSSINLACFLRILKHVHGEDSRNILLANSAGSLITRHYTVSKYYKPGTVERFMMLAPPNKGSQAALMHINDGDSSDGDGTAAKELLPGSRFLNCLNSCVQGDSRCQEAFMINPSLQNSHGLNPDISCVIVAGEVKDVFIEKTKEAAEQLRKTAEEVWQWLDSCINGAGRSNRKEINSGENNGIQAGKENWEDSLGLSELPKGDLLVSLESQLIDGVPYIILTYPHGTIQRPSGYGDERYRVMKTFILTGRLEGAKK